MNAAIDVEVALTTSHPRAKGSFFAEGTSEFIGAASLDLDAPHLDSKEHEFVS